MLSTRVLGQAARRLTADQQIPGSIPGGPFFGSSIYFPPQKYLSKRHLTLVCCFFESSGARTGLHIKEPQVHTELQSKMDPGMDHVHRIDVTCPAG